MKRMRPFAAAVIAVLIAGGLAVGLTGSANAAPGSVRMVVFDCPGQAPQARPKDFILTCADANSALERLSWTSWTPKLASASGSLVLNDCKPDCASGHFHAYPALVVLWGSKAVKNHRGERAYTMMTQILTGQRPRYYDYLTHKWVTAPVTQTTRLLTSS